MNDKTKVRLAYETKCKENEVMARVLSKIP